MPCPYKSGVTSDHFGVGKRHLECPPSPTRAIANPSPVPFPTPLSVSAREKVRRLVLIPLMRSVAPFIEFNNFGKSSLRYSRSMSSALSCTGLAKSLDIATVMVYGLAILAGGLFLFLPLFLPLRGDNEVTRQTDTRFAIGNNLTFIY